MEKPGACQEQDAAAAAAAAGRESLALFVSLTANQRGRCCKLWRVSHGAKAQSRIRETPAANCKWAAALPVCLFVLCALLLLSRLSEYRSTKTVNEKT